MTTFKYLQRRMLVGCEIVYPVEPPKVQGQASGLNTVIISNAYKIQLEQFLITSPTPAENRKQLLLRTLGFSDLLASQECRAGRTGAERYGLIPRKMKSCLQIKRGLLQSSTLSELDRKHSTKTWPPAKEQGNLPVLGLTLAEMFSPTTHSLLQRLCHFSAKQLQTTCK